LKNLLPSLFRVKRYFQENQQNFITSSFINLISTNYLKENGQFSTSLYLPNITFFLLLPDRMPVASERLCPFSPKAFLPRKHSKDDPSIPTF